MLICAENSSWKQYAQLLKICKAWVKGVLFWFYFFFSSQEMIHKQ